MAKLPDHLGKAESDEIERRRKPRNWAVLIVLAGLAALFYAITVVKMGH